MRSGAVAKAKTPEPAPEPGANATLPHNLDAERAVLGAILIDGGVHVTVASVVQAADFYRDAHRRIYEAMTTILDRPGGAVDFVLLREELLRRGDLDAVGGPMYLSTLADGVPSTLNVRHYATVIRDKARARATIQTLSAGVRAAYDDSDSIDDVLQRIDSDVLALRRTTGRGATLLRHRTADLLRDLEFRSSNRGKLFGVSTGFACLDEMTLGWMPGAMVVVGARPSMGKTALVANMLQAAAQYPLPPGETGTRVGLMFSLEMDARQIELRLLSSLSRIPLHRLLAGLLGGSDWSVLATALDALHGLHVVIDDTAALTVGDVRARCREVLAAHGRLDLVVIDYIQLMTGSLQRRNATRTEELADISKRLKGLARELAVPVIVLSQLRRLGGGLPTLEDLRECGNLEQDADVVLFLHRKRHTDEGTTKLLIAKHRNGATGVRQLQFLPEVVTFEDRGQAPPEAAEEEKADAADAEKRRKGVFAKRRHQGRRGLIDD